MKTSKFLHRGQKVKITDNQIKNLRLFKNNGEHTQFHLKAYKYLVQLGLEENYYEWFKKKY
jgi:hypothetical protein